MCMHTLTLTLYVHMCEWWPEVNIGCLPLLLSTFSIETVSLTEPRAQQRLEWLASR